MQEIGHFKVLGAFIDGILSRDEYQGRGIPHKHFLVPAIDKTGLDRDEMVQMIMDLIRTIRIEINRTVEKSSHMVIPNRAYKKVVKDVADTFIKPKKSKHISQQATEALPAATEMSPKLSALQFKFDNFRDLPAEVDDGVISEILTDCNGNKWSLALYPGGDTCKS